MEDKENQENKEAKEETKNDRKKRKKKFKKWEPCKHDYAYCYYSHKNKESVYQCVNCGKWLYC